MQICDAENKMRDSRSITHPADFDIARDIFHARFTVKIAGFDSERVASKFQKIKTKPDDKRQRRMNAWKITGDNCVECPDNC